MLIAVYDWCITSGFIIWATAVIISFYRLFDVISEALWATVENKWEEYRYDRSLRMARGKHAAVTQEEVAALAAHWAGLPAARG